VLTDVKESYLRAVGTLASVPDIDAGDIRVAYTALHGVGQPLFLEAMRRRGFRHLFPVDEQATPDPEFSTVAFPNPEKPGALDLVLGAARANGCDLVLANDHPDAARLGVAVSGRQGDYTILKGSFTLYHAGRRDADHRLSCQWRPQGNSHLCERPNSKEKRRSRPERGPACRQRAVTPVPVEPPAGPR
jgi:phosphomannomutase